MGKWVCIVLATCMVAACGGETDQTGGVGGSGGIGGAGGTGGAGGSANEIQEDERCRSFSFTACGGDLTGSWTIDYSCGSHLNVSDLFPEVWGMPSSCMFLDTDIAYEVVGSLEYGDMTEVGDLDYRGTFRYEIPNDCLAGLQEDQAPEETCAEVGRRAAPGVPDACIPGANACVCEYDKKGEMRGTRGLEELFEGAMNYAGTEDGFSYCVDGNSLVQHHGDHMIWLVRTP